jgi:hypothetical protein
MRYSAGSGSSLLDRLDLALGKAAAFCGSALSGRSGIGDLIASIGVFATGFGVFFWLMRRLFSGRS